MKLSIHSEVGMLQSLIVHTPGNEVSLVNPESKDELLFDDIIFEEDARREHFDMLKIFETAMPADGKIYEITDLFSSCLQDEAARRFFINLMIKKLPKDNLNVIREELLQLSPEELLQFVIEGATPAIPGFTLPPNPNLLFTRDLAAVAGDQILLSRPAKEARRREALLVEMMIKHHPLFSEIRPNLITTSNRQSIEGGDILVASENVVLIGMSERTSFNALMIVAEALLSRQFDYVVAVDIPKKRSSMHLDTIFTFASRNECIVFPPVINEKASNISILSRENGKLHSTTRDSLQRVLEELLERDMHFIKCGGGNRTDQFREQWTDGANVFALAPGVIVGYDRNKKTFQALQEHGYKILNQFEFIDQYADVPFEPSDAKIAIHFAGHELCRGRGGARCMTMPISRKS